MGLMEWITNLFSPFFNLIFYPIVHFFPPRLALIIVSLIITFITTMAQKLLTNQQAMKSLREEQVKFREQMKQHRSDPVKMAEIQKQSMEKTLQYTKHSFRPMLFTFIPLIAMFGWLKNNFLSVGDIFSWGFHLPFFGTGIGWLWTYILCSVIFSIIIRKLFKIY